MCQGFYADRTAGGHRRHRASHQDAVAGLEGLVEVDQVRIEHAADQPERNDARRRARGRHAERYEFCRA